MLSKRDPDFPVGVLVLGATSSIAIATMRRLVAPSRRFMLVGRNSDRLTAVAQDLLARGAASVDTWVMDLDDTAGHAEMLTVAAERLGRIDLALIAHGVLGDQQAAELNFEIAAGILHTNFVSTVSLLTWLGNYLQEQRAGTLAVISSVAGDRGRRSNYVYGASKGALSLFMEGLRNRIDRDGVQVLTIKPGFVATPMTAHVEQNFLFASPRQVADGILRAVERRRDVVYVPGFWAPIMFLVRADPRLSIQKDEYVEVAHSSPLFGLSGFFFALIFRFKRFVRSLTSKNLTQANGRLEWATQRVFYPYALSVAALNSNEAEFMQ